jgi:hypothetical protein
MFLFGLMTGRHRISKVNSNCTQLSISNFFRSNKSDIAALVVPHMVLRWCSTNVRVYLETVQITTYPFHFRESHFISASAVRTTVTQLYEFSTVVPYSLQNPSRKLTKIELPSIDNSTPSRMHIFAISILPVLLSPRLYILSARLGAPLPASSVAQMPRPLFVVLASLHPPGNTLHQNVCVSVNAPGWSSSRQTWINRIRSGDEAHLRIEVESIAGHGPHTLRFQIDEEGAQTVFCDVPVESGSARHDLPPWVCGLALIFQQMRTF